MSVYVYDVVRTGRGKARESGGLAHIPPLELLTRVATALATRNGLRDGALQDLVGGTATQWGSQGGNIARAAAILAGWGSTTSGLMLNRFCSSGVDAINTAAAQVGFGSASLVGAGGVESISSAPMYSDRGPLFTDDEIVARAGSVAMGISADVIATLELFEREELDAYGLRTQKRAAAAWSDGIFERELLPVERADGGLFAADEAMRPQTTSESLAALEPAFEHLGRSGQDDLVRQHHPELTEIRHLHTVGTSPTLVDAASLLLIGDENAGREQSLTPRARIVAAATAVVDPVIMLTAGQRSTEDVLRRAGVHPSDVAVYEVAEAFAASCLRFQRDLSIEDDRFNPHGGTIAMGHAFGATGAILAANCIGELERRGARYGVIAVSGAAGVGSATLFERL